MVYRSYCATLILATTLFSSFLVSCSQQKSQNAEDNSSGQYFSSTGKPKSSKKEIIDLKTRRKARCFYLHLENNFLKKTGSRKYSSPSLIGVFNRNETQFLFEGSPHGKNPMWLELIKKTPREVYDTSHDAGFDHRIQAEFVGKTTSGKSRIKISSVKDSMFQLEEELSVDVPIGGSVILKTSKPQDGSKAEFLWIEIYEIKDIHAEDLLRNTKNPKSDKKSI